MNIFNSAPNSPKSPEYAPYSPAAIDYENDPNATPLNIFNSSSENTKNSQPNTPLPIKGGYNGVRDIVIDKLSDGQQKKLLELLKKRTELNKKQEVIGTSHSIFDADTSDNNDTSQGGSTNKDIILK